MKGNHAVLSVWQAHELTGSMMVKCESIAELAIQVCLSHRVCLTFARFADRLQQKRINWPACRVINNCL